MNKNLTKKFSILLWLITKIAVIMLTVIACQYIPPNYISLSILRNTSLTLIGLFGLMASLAVPMVTIFSSLKDRFGKDFDEICEIMSNNKVHLKKLVRNTFILILVLLLITSFDISFKSGYLFPNLYYDLYKRLFFIIVCIPSIFLGYKYVQLIHFIIWLYSENKLRKKLMNDLASTISKSDPLSINRQNVIQSVSILVNLEKAYILNKPASDENILEEDTALGAYIIKLMLKLEDKELKRAEIKFLIQHYVRLFPFYLKNIDRQNYLRLCSDMTYIFRKVLLDEKGVFTEVSVMCLNTYFSIALSMDETLANPELGIATDAILPLCYSEHRHCPPLNVIDAYCQQALQYYSRKSKNNHNHLIFIQFVENMNLSSFGDYQLNYFPNYLNEEYEITKDLDLAKNNLEYIKTCIDKYSDNENLCAELSYYYFYLILQQLMCFIIVNMIYQKDYLSAFKVLNIHSPIASKSINVGINFISYNVNFHLSRKELEFFFLGGSLDMGQSENYYGSFIGLLIIFNCIRETIAKGTYSILNSGDSGYNLTIQVCNVAIRRLENAARFIKSPYWQNPIKELIFNDLALDSVQSTCLKYTNEQIEFYKGQIKNIEGGAKISEAIYTRYKSEILQDNNPKIGHLTLYSGNHIKLTTQITHSRKLNNKLRRAALLENTGSYYIFSNGFNMLQHLHNVTIHAYLTKRGSPLSYFPTIITTLKSDDVIFISYSDKESLGNIINQEIFKTILLPNGQQMNVESIPCREVLGVFWVCEPETPIFHYEQNNLITFEPNNADAFPDGEEVIVTSTYHIEPVDKLINESVVKEINLNYSMD